MSRGVRVLKAVVARHPVGLIAATVFALLVAVANRYGWHRDELYFLACGRHLAWGYVDQPPLTPLLARLADVVAHGNVVVLRTIAALATVATINLGAVIVRELGGDKAAQVAGAAAVAAGGFVLGVGHGLFTATIDLTAWMGLLAITVRLLRTDDTRWWLAFGGLAGISMLNKNLLVLLGGALFIGLVVERRWSLLRSGWLVAGAAIAALIAAPNLVWQAQHGWPQIEMAGVLAARLGTLNRVTMLPFQVLFVGPAFVVVLWRGARWLATEPIARPFRPLLWAWPSALVATFITGGRPYYVIPLTTTVMLAGIIATGRVHPVRSLAPYIIANAVVSAFIALPLLPASSANVSASINEAVAETIGWPELTAEVAHAVKALPAPEQQSVVLLAGTYGEAGALDLFGPRYGLPSAYSPHNGYADFGHPRDDGATVVAVRLDMPELVPYFTQCDPVGHVDNHQGVDNESQGAPIIVCRGLRRPWAQTWARMRFLG